MAETNLFVEISVLYFDSCCTYTCMYEGQANENQGIETNGEGEFYVVEATL